MIIVRNSPPWLTVCFKTKILKKILFLREVMDKIVFSPLIAVNEMLTSHSENLSTYITSSLFRHAISSRPDHATVFSRCCHVFKRKPKAIELLFCAKESGKKKKKQSLFPLFRFFRHF